MTDPAFYQDNIVWDVTWEQYGALLLTEFGIDRRHANGRVRSMDGDPDQPLDMLNYADEHLLADAVLALLPPAQPVSRVGWERVPYLILFGRNELAVTTFIANGENTRDALSDLNTPSADFIMDYNALPDALGELHTPNAAHEWFFVCGDPSAHAPEALRAAARRLDSAGDRTPTEVLTELVNSYTAVVYGASRYVTWATRAAPGLAAQQYTALADVAARYGLVLLPPDVQDVSEYTAAS